MRYLKIFALLVTLNLSAWLIPQEAFAQQGDVSYQLFYDQLSPYGMWVNYPQYGYVWIPNVDASFSPYATNGHWIYTDDGWTWISDYPWGWATFHYGRWDYDNVYGWLWVPDNEWGPAWVSWRSSPGYYGWAPLGPGISMSIAFGSNYHVPSERWIFVRDRNFTSPSISRYYINRTKNVTIINHSTIIVNTLRNNNRSSTYIAGPKRTDVQRYSRTPVKSVPIRAINQPGQHLTNNVLQIYRPQVQKMSGNGHKPVPPKVMRLNDVRPLSVRNAANQQRGTKPNKNTVIQHSLPKNNQRNVGNQQRAVNPTENANKYQKPVQRNVNPLNVKRTNKHPQNIIQQKKNAVIQHTQPKPNQRNVGNQQRGVKPTNNIRKYQQPVQRNVNPPNIKETNKRPQNIVQPKKNSVIQHSQPRSNQRKQVIKKTNEKKRIEQS
ncbi:MAG: DUF6600 domain-containing protein [Ignavibacteriaceae bacterium]